MSSLVSARSTPDELRSSTSLDRVAGCVLGVCVVLALVAVYFLCLRPIAATDFWWQLRTGELIVRTGSIPTRDPFSWTAAGQPWTVHEWLTEVLFYLLYEHLPRWVLLGYKAGLGVVACGLVLARAWQRTRSLALGILAALLAAWVLRNYADLRPQMMSFVLLAGLLLALDRYQEERAPWLPWALPALFALWANLHGGVIVGLILLALWLVGQAVGRFVFRERAPGLGALFLGLVVSALAVCANPNGYQVYAYPFQVLGHPEVMDYIAEWWSPNFHNQGLRGFEVALLGTPGLLALARQAPAERRMGDLLVLLALAHAALGSQRHTATFGLVAAPLFTVGLAGLWNEARGLHPTLAVAGKPAVRAAAACTLAVALIGLITAQVPRRPVAEWFDYAVRMQDFPRDAVQMLGDGMWPGNLYNDYIWGGYLIWELYPRRRVFIDGRAEVYYPTKAFDDEMRIHRVAPGWQEVLNRREVEVVLTSAHGDLARALEKEPNWKLAFTGSVEVVYTRVKEGGERARP